MVDSGSTAEWAPNPVRSNLASAYACSIVSDPENAVTILPSAARSSRSASSSAASHDIGSRPMRSTRRSGSVILSDAYRCG